MPGDDQFGEGGLIMTIMTLLAENKILTKTFRASPSSSSVLSVPSDTVLFLLIAFGTESELLKNQFVGRIWRRTNHLRLFFLFFVPLITSF